MKTGNWDGVNASGFSMAEELNKTHNPVSKLTDLHVSFVRHQSKHSVRCSIPGNIVTVSDGAVNTYPVINSKVTTPPFAQTSDFCRKKVKRLDEEVINFYIILRNSRLVCNLEILHKLIIKSLVSFSSKSYIFIKI